MTQVFVLLGAPGSGKGTQAKRLKETFSATHISTGDMLRAEVALKSELGLKLEAILNRGELVSDQLITDLFDAALSRNDASHMIADGYPRTLAQAKSLSGDLATKYGLKLIPVLLDVPKDVIIKRIEDRKVCPTCKTIYDSLINVPLKAGVCNDCQTPLEKRRDDDANVVLDRFDTYQREIQPVLDFFNDSLIRIPADRDPEVVYADISARLQGAEASND